MLLHPLSRDRIQRLEIERIKHCERIPLFPHFLQSIPPFFSFIQLQPPRFLHPSIPRAVQYTAGGKIEAPIDAEKAGAVAERFRQVGWE